MSAARWGGSYSAFSGVGKLETNEAVGKGVREVRINVSQFRAFYVTNIGNAVYVLHAFQEKGAENQLERHLPWGVSDSGR